MNPGKLWTTVLKRSVLKNLSHKDGSLTMKPQIGADAGAFMFNENEILIASAVREGNHPVYAAYAIYNAVNNIYVKFGKPIGISVTLTLPVDLKEPELKQFINMIDKTCNELSIEVIGGHTLVSSNNLTSAVIGITAVGVVSNGTEVPGLKSFDSQVQDVAYNKIRSNLCDYSILMTKFAGMEGTMRFIERFGEQLKARYTGDFLENGRRFTESLSVAPEVTAIINYISGNGETSRFYDEVFCHDVSEGGIFSALWEISEFLSCGMKIDIKKIPLKQVTIEVCEYLDRNPYLLQSGGSMLVVTKQPEQLKSMLCQNKIPAEIIGVITDSKDCLLVNNGEHRYLEPFRGDSLNI